MWMWKWIQTVRRVGGGNAVPPDPSPSSRLIPIATTQMLTWTTRRNHVCGMSNGKHPKAASWLHKEGSGKATGRKIGNLFSVCVCVEIGIQTTEPQGDVQGPERGGGEQLG